MLTGLALVVPLCQLINLLPLPKTNAAFQLRSLARFNHPGPLVLTGVIIYPLLEEIVYRGLMLPLSRRYLRLGTAIWGSTLVFAATHIRPDMSWGTPIFALLAGFYFAWLSIGSRSLYPSILCHATINFSVWFVIHPLLTVYAGNASDPLTSPVALGLLAGSLALLVTGVAILRTEFRPGPIRDRN